MNRRTGMWVACGLLIGALILGVIGFRYGGTEGDGDDAEIDLILGDSDPAANPDATLVELEDPGPGRCFPDYLKQARTQAEAGDFEGEEDIGDFQPPYTEAEKDKLHAALTVWVTKHWDKPCVRGQARVVAFHADYYMVGEVLADRHNRLNPDDEPIDSWNFDPNSKIQFVSYFEEMILDDPDVATTWNNHAFKDGEWRSIGMQTFPAGELLLFVPGYEPFNKHGNAIRAGFKFVCGNPLPPALPPKEEAPPEEAPPVEPPPERPPPEEPPPDERKLVVPVPGDGGPDSGQAPNTDFAPADPPAGHDFSNPDCQDDGYCGGTRPQTPIATPPTRPDPPEVQDPEDTPATGEDSGGVVTGP